MILASDDPCLSPSKPPEEKGWIEVEHPGLTARSEADLTLASARLVARGVRIIVPAAMISWHPNHVDVPVEL
jgi:hypothetical protein